MSHALEDAPIVDRVSTDRGADADVESGPALPFDLSHYTVRRQLGAGGMGVVYEAEDHIHPNVVHVYEIGRAEGRTFIAMELALSRRQPNERGSPGPRRVGDDVARRVTARASGSKARTSVGG
ncbi:MAG: hypothetical protein K0V04_11950 [Deltaproteobacteria bacterium]|nr:hypothetical protein [Deltaproteobacteria bacterium]